MFYVIIKGKYAQSKLPYETHEQALAGWARAKRKLAFAHCVITLEN